MQPRSYEDYLRSDYCWVDHYPKHWEVRRFRFLLRDGYEGLKIGPFGSQIKLEDMISDGIKVYGQENIIKRNFSIGTRFISEEKFVELQVYEIQPGDLLITMMGTSGKCEIAPQSMSKGIMDSHLMRLRVNEKLLPEFVKYLIDESAYVKCQIDLLGKGSIMHGLNSSIIKELSFLLPPIEEQCSIVNFLDYKTGQLDHLIKKKQALIDKLNEQYNSVLTKAVTKGLNSDAPMKYSGVEWLGEIPSHWGLRRLKFLATQNLKYGANEAAELDDRDLPRYIRITDVKEDGTLHDETFRSIPEEIAEPYLLDEGDILLARSGATVGKSFQYNNSWGRAAYAGYLICFRTNAEIILSDFAYFFCNSGAYWANINSTLIQSTIQNFSAEKYNNIVVPLPPIEEQEEIVETLYEQLSDIEEMKRKAIDIIHILQEYRVSIINSAVTGQLDIHSFKRSMGNG